MEHRKGRTREMKKTVKLMLGIMAAGLLLAGSGCTAGNSGNQDYATGTPWIYSSIDGTVTEDTPADPKDDFYLDANKEKLVSGELTDEKPEIGTANDVDEKVEADILKMYTEGKPESHDAQLVYDLYYLAGDWETRDALGVAPLKEKTDEIEAV